MAEEAKGWRPIEMAPTDQEILVKGGTYLVAAETYPDWYEHRGVSLVQWREGDGWRGEERDGDFIWYRPTHFITVADLLTLPEPPQ